MESVPNTQKREEGEEKPSQEEIDRRKQFEQLYHDIRTKQENKKYPNLQYIDGEDNIDVFSTKKEIDSDDYEN